MKQSRLSIAQADIFKHFDQLQDRVMKLSDIASILVEQREFWRLAQRTTTGHFVEFLKTSGKLKQLDFPFPYRAETRYVWGDVHLLETLLTLKKDAYYSHYTAMRMHGLTEQIPKTIYLNHEQRPQPQNPSLEQGRIDAAFSRKPRVSNNIIDRDDLRICLVNGMHTNQLGVISSKVSYDSNEKVKVRLTNIERTLIDITVRPVYSGGVFEVGKAFELAKDQVSVNALSALFQKLKYVYPYHQAIGFYLERAGYKPSVLDMLRRFPIEYDFYLAQQMQKTRYVKEWRIFVPEGF